MKLARLIHRRQASDEAIRSAILPQPGTAVPEHLSFLLRHLAVGALAGVLLGLLILAVDLAGLRTLLLGPGGGSLALGLFFFGLVVTFGSAAMGAGIMGLGRSRN